MKALLLASSVVLPPAYKWTKLTVYGGHTYRYEGCDEEEFKQNLSDAIANHDYQPPIMSFFKEIS